MRVSARWWNLSSGHVSRITGHGRFGLRLRMLPQSVVASCLMFAPLAGTAFAAGTGAAPLTWQHVSSPNVSKNQTVLDAVSCASSTRCVAVGESSTKGRNSELILIETWNGTKWSVTPPVDQTGWLYGVSCVSSTACMAVGNRAVHSKFHTLIMTLQGAAWKVAPSPTMGEESHLNAVSCTSASSCVAVGDYVNSSGVDQTLIEAWDGKSWSVTPSPDSPDVFNDLYGVSCVSVTDCVAAGQAVGNSADTLIESWDGASWSLVSSPNPSGYANYLFGVSCASSVSCVTVGLSNSADSSTGTTLIETWDGTSWSVTPSPASANYSSLAGVSCVSSTNCVAVGNSPRASERTASLIESLNGSTWSVTPSPNPGKSENVLAGASCTRSSSCEAVGDYLNPGKQPRTLVEKGT
jgi:hypothetical protein